MPNKYYNRSKRKEQQIVREAKAKGHIALRSAGSKSPIDVVDIDYANRKIWLVQVKTGNLSESQFTKLCKEYAYLNGKYEVEYILCHYP